MMLKKMTGKGGMTSSVSLEKHHRGCIPMSCDPLPRYASFPNQEVDGIELDYRIDKVNDCDGKMCID